MSALILITMSCISAGVVQNGRELYIGSIINDWTHNNIDADLVDKLKLSYLNWTKNIEISH